MDPIECYDCGHPITVHLSSGCAQTDRDDETETCLCRMSPDDIGADHEENQD